MLQKISTNSLGIALLIVSILGWLNIEISIETAEEVVLALGTLLSVVVLIKNQVCRKDITAFFFRK